MNRFYGRIDFEEIGGKPVRSRLIQPIAPSKSQKAPEEQKKENFCRSTQSGALISSKELG